MQPVYNENRRIGQYFMYELCKYQTLHRHCANDRCAEECAHGIPHGIEHRFMVESALFRSISELCTDYALWIIHGASLESDFLRPVRTGPRCICACVLWISCETSRCTYCWRDAKAETGERMRCVCVRWTVKKNRWWFYFLGFCKWREPVSVIDVYFSWYKNFDIEICTYRIN